MYNKSERSRACVILQRLRQSQYKSDSLQDCQRTPFPQQFHTERRIQIEGLPRAENACLEVCRLLWRCVRLLCCINATQIYLVERIEQSCFLCSIHHWTHCLGRTCTIRWICSCLHRIELSNSNSLLKNTVPSLDV